jgi:hypothetical protein
MAAGYMPAWPVPDALMLMYSAKKKAEVSPGVGRSTDLVVDIGRGAGLIATSPEGIVALESYYQELQKAIEAKKNEVVWRLINDGKVFTVGTPVLPPPPGALES